MSTHGGALLGQNGVSSTPSQTEVVGSILFYMVTSITMVMVNKLVLDTVSIPFTFLWLQILVAILLLYGSSMFGILKSPRLDIEKCKGLVPMVIVNVVGLSLNTLCLQYVNASFYQVARSLILPFTVFLTWVMLRKPSSLFVLFSCAIVFIGFLVGVWGELKPSWLGVLFGLTSSFTTAIHAVIIKQSLDIVDQSTMTLVFYNNVLSGIALMPIVFFSNELPTFYDILVGGSAAKTGFRFFVGTLVTGLFGFLINVAGFMQIKVTSPVTHMISSAVRGVLQTLLAMAIFNDTVTIANAAGIALILTGSSLYTWAKSIESQAKPGA